MSTYDEVVGEVAHDLDIAESVLRSWFSIWINWDYERRMKEVTTGNVARARDAACYAVYRLTKSASAFEMAMKSVERRGAKIGELKDALSGRKNEMIVQEVAAREHLRRLEITLGYLSATPADVRERLVALIEPKETAGEYVERKA